MAHPPAGRFEDLLVWQKSHALVLRVYRLSARFPKEEIYGLVAQMRRCAVSVPSNIAEGFSKRSRIVWNDLDEVARMLGGYMRGVISA